jgi:hypothetical protein
MELIKQLPVLKLSEMLPETPLLLFHNTMLFTSVLEQTILTILLPIMLLTMDLNKLLLLLLEKTLEPTE